jgi:hypothetical protein
VKPQAPVLPKLWGTPHIIFAADQPEYLQLPAIRPTALGAARITTRWKLTWRERAQVLFGGNLWLQILTFGNPLQPVKMLTKEPSLEECW